MLHPEDSNQKKGNNLSEYDRLIAEIKKEMAPIIEETHKEIVEYLLSIYTDRGLALKVIEDACNDALEQIRRNEKRFEF